MDDSSNSVLIYIRKGEDKKEDVIVACNMTPSPLEDYKIGLPKSGKLNEIFNTDSKKYNGTGSFKNKQLKSKKLKYHNRTYSTTITLPPLALVAFKYV